MPPPFFKTSIVEQGRAADYMAFIESIDNAPRVDAADAEERRLYTSALQLVEGRRLGGAGRGISQGDIESVPPRRDGRHSHARRCPARRCRRRKSLCRRANGALSRQPLYRGRYGRKGRPPLCPQRYPRALAVWGSSWLSVPPCLGGYCGAIWAPCVPHAIWATTLWPLRMPTPSRIVAPRHRARHRGRAMFTRPAPEADGKVDEAIAHFGRARPATPPTSSAPRAPTAPQRPLYGRPTSRGPARGAGPHAVGLAAPLLGGPRLYPHERHLQRAGQGTSRPENISGSARELSPAARPIFS